MSNQANPGNPPSFDRNLESIYNLLFMMSRENPDHEENIMELYNAIAVRYSAISNAPLASDRELKEINIILEEMENSLEQSVLPAGETGFPIDNVYSKELIRSIGILRFDLSDHIKSYIKDREPERQPELPGEQPAPIRVSIENNKLVLSSTHHQIGTINFNSANRVRESLRDTFSDLIDQLPNSSNIDVRYLAACKKLLVYLSEPLEQVSIEALGLNYQLVDKMTKRMASEISGIIIDQLEHTLTGISVLLNQFQEWKDYLEALALSQALGAEGAQLVEYANAIAKEFGRHPHLVETGIVRRIEEMIEPVIAGFMDADTISVPLAGSLSNIFAALSHVALEHISNADTQIFPTAGAAVSVLLANFAVTMINKFCPVLSQFHPLKFLIEMQKYIQKYFSLLKDASRLGTAF